MTNVIDSPEAAPAPTELSGEAYGQLVEAYTWQDPRGADLFFAAPYRGKDRNHNLVVRSGEPGPTYKLEYDGDEGEGVQELRFCAYRDADGSVKTVSYPDRDGKTAEITPEDIAHIAEITPIAFAEYERQKAAAAEARANRKGFLGRTVSRLLRR